MNSMKRIVCLLLSLLLPVLLLCACKEGGGESGVPDGCLKAESEALDFFFCYPEEWELDRNDGMLSVRCNVGTQLNTVYASVSAMAFGLSDPLMGANNYWDEYRSQLETNFPGMEFIKEKEEIKLGGVVANRNRCKFEQDGLEICFETAVCVKNGSVYLVTLTVPERSYADARGGYDTILSTFAFL